MGKEETLKGLYDAILTLNKAAAGTIAKELIETGIDPSEAVENWMAPAMEEMGRLERVVRPTVQLGSQWTWAVAVVMETSAVLKPRAVEAVVQFA